MKDSIEGISHRTEVTKRVVKSAFALGIRQVLVHGLNVAGAILLARLLAPVDYGVYAIVTFFIAFLGAFGGTGLAASLIREWPEPPANAYRTVYSYQQVFVAALAIFIWFASPRIASLYHLDSKDAWIFRLAALSLVATTWMVPPQIEMERNLQFQKLAVIETAQALAFNVIAVGMAWFRYGAISFGIALFARSLTGAILANVIQPFKPGWLFDWSLAKPHLRFGLFYQSAQLISIVKDSITPVLIGFMVGTAGVGYLSWAAMLAAYPVLVLTVLQRLYLPAFAQLQDDLDHLGTFIEQSIWATNAAAAPLAVLLLVLVYPVTDVIFGAKWAVAIPLFYLFWTANLFVPTAMPVQSVLNAIGKAHLATLFAGLWMVLTWGLGWPLAVWKGIIGIAIAAALVQISNLLLFRVAQNYVKFRILRTIFVPWIVASGMGVLLFLLSRHVPPKNLWSLIGIALIGVLVYSGVLVLAYRRRLSKLFHLSIQP